jgi:RNA 2',3'-cyclic 3'-phosphodiesterase
MTQAPGTAKHRLFIAMPIPERVKDEIQRVQDALRTTLPKQCVRFTKREQFHLTLRFLGNIDVRREEQVVDQVRTACREFFSFKLRAERIGCFPDLRFPRVVWVWVHDDAEQLQSLHGKIGRATTSFAEKDDEKDFTGHVTIARLNGVKRQQADALAKVAHEMSGRFFGEWVADEVEIIRSDLSSSGSRYTTLAGIRLEEKNYAN